jgi:hypothetical protein
MWIRKRPRHKARADPAQGSVHKGYRHGTLPEEALAELPVAKVPYRGP